MTEILETAWLHRSKVNTCNEEWRSTLYGENSFYRTDEIPGKFRDHFHKNCTRHFLLRIKADLCELSLLRSVTYMTEFGPIFYSNYRSVI